MPARPLRRKAWTVTFADATCVIASSLSDIKSEASVTVVRVWSKIDRPLSAIYEVLIIKKKYVNVRSPRKISVYMQDNLKHSVTKVYVVCWWYFAFVVNWHFVEHVTIVCLANVVLCKARILNDSNFPRNHRTYITAILFIYWKTYIGIFMFIIVHEI